VIVAPPRPSPRSSSSGPARRRGQAQHLAVLACRMLTWWGAAIGGEIRANLRQPPILMSCRAGIRGFVPPPTNRNRPVCCRRSIRVAECRELICDALPLYGRFGILRFVASRMAVPVVTSQPGTRDIGKTQCPAEGVKNGQRRDAGGDRRPAGGPASRTGNPELDDAARNAGRLGDLR